MQDQLPVLILLLVVLAGVGLLAARLRAPAPVLLALAGAAAAAVPGVPRLPLHPDLILVLFLPPLLYADAFQTSWVDFRRWLRPIVMLAVGLVAATILVVGFVTKWLLPDLPYPVCFVLGAIVSPTDTVAVQAVIERLRIPRRITAILGGESLVNDATGLVGVQIGVAVVLSGAFDAGLVALDFAYVACGGALVGLAVGALFAAGNRFVRDTQVLFVMSILSPYLAYFVAQHFAMSGVLAVVVAGFVVAWRIHIVPAVARVELYSTWGLIVHVLNGFCFVFVGLEAPELIVEIAERDGAAAWDLTIAAIVVAGVTMVMRVLWCFPAAFLPFVLAKDFVRREGEKPSWRHVLLVSWCGVRGVVSLAAALALPRTMGDGAPFPGRDAVLACTLGVILATLVVQGLTLLPLIRLLGIRDDEQTEGEVRSARQDVLAAGIARLDEFCSERSCPVAVHHLREAMADELTALKDADLDARHRASARLAVSLEVRTAVAAAQSQALLRLRDAGRINDRTYTAMQLEMDRRQWNAG